MNIVSPFGDFHIHQNKTILAIGYDSPRKDANPSGEIILPQWCLTL